MNNKLINIVHKIYLTDLSVKNIYVEQTSSETRVIILSDNVSSDFTAWESEGIKFVLTSITDKKIPSGWSLKDLIPRPISINLLYESFLKVKESNSLLSERLNNLEPTEGFFEIIHQFLIKLGYITSDGKYSRGKPVADQEIMKSLGYV